MEVKPAMARGTEGRKIPSPNHPSALPPSLPLQASPHCQGDRETAPCPPRTPLPHPSQAIQMQAAP